MKDNDFTGILCEEGFDDVHEDGEHPGLVDEVESPGVEREGVG